jgi:RimJ/RimL family protein N-acetyltransferase
MIQMALDPQALQIAANILLREVGVEPCGDLKAIFWVNKDNEIEWVVGYTAFIGKTCQMHVVNLKGKPINRALVQAAFDYPFNYCGIEKTFALVNGNNEKAMNFDLKLGFKEELRYKGLHEGGGDIVLLTMDKADCKWIRELKHAA